MISREHDISVIIVTYNSHLVIVSALESVQRHLKRAEIIVVDNGSTDETLAILRKYDDVTVIASDENVGFGAAANAGVCAASSRLVMILNPDLRVLAVNETLLEQLACLPEVGLIGLAPGAGRSVADGAIPAWPWPREMMWAFLSWFVVPREVRLHRPGLKEGHVGWVTGAALIVARDEFLAVGGFDDRIFLYYEDFDLARRYRALGHPIRVRAVVEIDHRGQASSPRDEPFLVACAILSLVQTTATWQGVEVLSVRRGLLTRCYERWSGQVEF